MRFGRLALLFAISIASTIPAVAAARTRHSTSSKTLTRHATKSKLQSQRGIDDERATQIQDALIKAGYLSGTPSGHWDAASQAAMAKVQSDNGWQTKFVPDSRALIKLGLGPSADSVDSLANQPTALVTGQPGIQVSAPAP